MADNQMIKIEFDFDLGNVPASAKKFGDYLKGIQTNSKETENQLKQLGNAVAQTAQKMDSAGSTIKKTNQQWTNFALIIQDLPYGFRGIQNNLPAVIGGFASMTGPIYLAGSAIIAFFAAYDMGLFKTIGGINQFQEANKKAIDSVKQEATNVLLLVEQYKKSNTTSEERVAIIKKLNDINPQYFGNLNAENTSIKLLNDAYLAYVANLGNVIKAKKLEEKLTKLIEERLKYETEAGIALLKSGYRNPELINQQNAALKKYNAMLQQEADLAKQITDLAKVKLDLDEKTTKNKTEKTKADKVAARIAKGVALAGGDIQPIAEPLPKQDKGNLDQQIKILDETSKTRIGIIKEQYQTEVSLAEGSFEKIKQAQSNMRDKLDEEFKAGLIGTVQYSQAIQDLVQQQNNTIYEQAKANFEHLLQLGNGIMSALGPSLDMLIDKGASLGDVLTSAFQDLLKQLAKVIIAAGIAVLLLSAIGLVEPGGAFKLFSSLFSQGMGLGKNLFETKKFADGGIISGPTYGLMGEYPGAKSNPEVVAPLDKLKSMIGGGGSGEFVLRGNDLVLALQRSNSSLTLRR
jgi:hypothetical protein